MTCRKRKCPTPRARFLTMTRRLKRITRRTPDDDSLDGCDIAGRGEPTRDEDIAGLVLFCDVDFENADAVSRRQREWEALFHDGHRDRSASP